MRKSGITLDLLRSSEDILDEKLNGFFFFFCGLLINKNNRLYGTKNCSKNHCDICFKFLGIPLTIFEISLRRK